MALPKPLESKFKTKILSENKIVFGRPITVKEEKAILMAKHSEDTVEFLKNICNAIESIYNIKSENLTTFDIKYLMVAHRKNVIDNIIQLADFKCECGYIFTDETIDLSKDIKIKKPENFKKRETIPISDNISITLHIPTMKEILNNIEAFNKGEFTSIETIADCIEAFYDKEKDETITEFTKQEVIEWLEGLDISAFSKIVDWIGYNNIDVKIEKIFVCPKCKKEIKKELDGFIFF